MGNYVIDPQMLMVVGVAKEIYRPVDWASDLLVLKLCSADTAVKLATLGQEEVGSVAVLVVTLYFARLNLYSVNAKVACWHDC
eukprot:14494308-Ditylum_brightwellii.AAC.1